MCQWKGTNSRFGARLTLQFGPENGTSPNFLHVFPQRIKNHPSQIWAQFVHACWPGTLLSWGERWAIFLACFLLLSPYYAQLERRKEAKKSPALRRFFLSFPLSCEIYAQGAQKNILSRLRELIGWETKRQSSLPHFYRITLLCMHCWNLLGGSEVGWRRSFLKCSDFWIAQCLLGNSEYRNEWKPRREFVVVAVTVVIITVTVKSRYTLTPVSVTRPIRC